MKKISVIIAFISLLLPMKMAAQAPVDTIQTSNPHIQIILLEDNSWKMLSNGKAVSEEDAAGLLDVIYPGRKHDIASDTERQSRKSKATPAQTQEEPAKVAEAPAKPQSTTETKTADPVYHKVRSGDTLYAISKKYGTTVKNICKLNGISEKTTLSIGRKLRVK